MKFKHPARGTAFGQAYEMLGLRPGVEFEKFASCSKSTVLCSCVSREESRRRRRKIRRKAKKSGRSFKQEVFHQAKLRRENVLSVYVSSKRTTRVYVFCHKIALECVVLQKVDSKFELIIVGTHLLRPIDMSSISEANLSIVPGAGDVIYADTSKIRLGWEYSASHTKSGKRISELVLYHFTSITGTGLSNKEHSTNYYDIFVKYRTPKPGDLYRTIFGTGTFLCVENDVDNAHITGIDSHTGEISRTNRCYCYVTEPKTQDLKYASV